MGTHVKYWQLTVWQYFWSKLEINNLHLGVLGLLDNAPGMSKLEWCSSFNSWADPPTNESVCCICSECIICTRLTTWYFLHMWSICYSEIASHWSPSDSPLQYCIKIREQKRPEGNRGFQALPSTCDEMGAKSAALCNYECSLFPSPNIVERSIIHWSKT